MKLVGSMLIILSFFYLGKFEAYKLTRRISYIDTIIQILEFFKREIGYNSLPIFELISKLNNDIYFKSINIFRSLNNNLKNGSSLEKSWIKSVKESNLSNHLKLLELNEIKMIGSWLGKGSIENQISRINKTLESLQEAKNRAIIERDKYHKLYHSLGFLSGVTLVILIW